MTLTCRSTTVLAILSLVLGARFASADPPAAEAGRVIFDMDTIRHEPGEFTKDKQKVRAGTAELVDGKFGKAVKFSFVEGASGGFMVGHVRPTPDWDAAAGFSFWIKGHGAGTWGGIELIDRDDYALRYAFCFPVDSTEWRKVIVPWRDVIPELAGPLVGGKDRYSPAKFGSFSFGKWFYWRDYPAQSYAIDQVELEPTIAGVPDAPAAAVEPGLKRLRAKLARHEPVTIVTMGDSLTDDRHWSNRKVVWHRLLAEALKAKYGGDVKIVNPAIGGTTLNQNLILMPRWAEQAPSPDLVTVWFGGNDWSGGVRGPRFVEYLRLAVERIRRQTRGSADILLMTPCPSHERWETMKELERALRDVAKEEHTGLADVAAEFHKLPTPDDGVRQEYWAWDKVHLGPKGHAVTKDAVLQAIETEK